jgi:hypothetical protein
MKPWIVGGTAALMLAVAIGGCTAQESRRAAAEWIGKSRSQLDQQMGPPRQAVPMTDTGGVELFYTYEGHHYYFQTNARGIVETAVRTD